MKIANIAETIYEIRKLIDYNNDAETLAYTALKEFRAEKHPELTDEEFSDKLEELTSALVKATDENAEKVLNLASPAPILIEVDSYTAFAIQLAVNLFQIN